MVWLQVSRIKQLLGALLANLEELDREFILGINEDALVIVNRPLHDWALVLVLMLPTSLGFAVSICSLLLSIQRHSIRRDLMSHWNGRRLLHSLLVENVEGAAKLMLIFGMVVSLLCIFSTMLVLTGTWRCILRVLDALRRRVEGYLLEELHLVRTELFQRQKECELLRPYVDERKCNVCLDAEAKSIVIDCGHVDHCQECLERAEQHDAQFVDKGECPEYEGSCSQSGTVHVHCLICRGGGERRKVFFG